MRVSENDLAERLRRLGERSRLVLDRETRSRLAEYVALLFRWNERMNLTGVDADDEGLDRLVVEPLLAAGSIPKGSTSMVDIGSGGGSPAIPIKIRHPELSVRMIEGRMRKAAFLRETVRRLNLVGAVVENCRYQALDDRADVREAHDVLTVRGVRVDGRTAGEFQRLVRPGGVLLVFCSKGRSEVRGELQGLLRAERRLTLVPTAGSELLIIRKMNAGGGDCLRS